MKKLILALLLVFPCIALCQSNRDVTFLNTGTTLPATCSVGQSWILTSGAIGLYACTSANIWSPAGGSISKLSRDCRVDGMKADGVTDDSTAFNNCIANAVTNGQGIIQLPSGTINVTAAAINGTNRPGLTYQGGGTYGTNAPANSSGITLINCNTGGVCLDLTGSGYTVIRNLTIRGDGTLPTPSTIGILQGRDNALGGGTGRFCFAEHIKLDNVTIWMDHEVANAGRGSIGVYNIGAEIGQISNSHIFADTGYFISPTNDLSVTSPYQTLATGCAASAADTTFINTSIHVVSFAGLEIRGSIGVEIINMNILGDGITTGMIPILFDGASSSDVKMHVIIESFNAPAAGAIAYGVNCDSLRGEIYIGAQSGAAAAAIIPQAGGLALNNPGLRIGFLNATVNLAMSSGVAFAVNGGWLDIGGTTTPINQTNITLNGTLIKAQGFTDANVTFNAASSYERVTDSGITDFGAVTANGPVAITGSESITALATPSAPTVTPTCPACPNNGTWGYKIIAVDGNSSTSIASAETQVVNTQSATLDGTHFNVITWTAVKGATSYQVFRSTKATTPATLGIIGTVLQSATLTFTDNAVAGDSSTAPATNTTGGATFPSGAAVLWSTDTGLSRVAAGTVAVGNGTPGNTTGGLQLARIRTSGAAGMDINGTTHVGLGTALLTWNSNTDGSGQDTGLSRPSAKVVDVGNGAASDTSGFLKTSQTLEVTGSNFTTASATLVAVTGLTFTAPTSAATNWSYHCDLLYSQATAAAANLFGIITTQTAPTTLLAVGEVKTNNTGTQVDNNAVITTATSTTVVTATPSAFGAIGTNADEFIAHFYGTLEAPSNASPTQVAIAVATGNASDSITIYRGSACWWY